MPTPQATENDDSGGEADGFVTPEEARKEFNLLEEVRSHFGVDDDYLAAMLANQIQMGRVERRQTELLEEIRDQRGPPLVGEFPIEMSHDVPADTPAEDPHTVERVPNEEESTKIVAVTLGWADGANNAVGIQLRTGNGLKLIPRNPEDDYMAFNDFTDTFDMVYELEPGETLVAQTVNLDTGNSHFVNIVPHVEERVSDETGDGGGE